MALSSLVSPVLGTWKTLDGTEISINQCASGFCGVLSFVVMPKEFQAQCEQMAHDAVAEAMHDENNPDPTLKTRPILGMEMMTLTPTSDPDSFNAVVYNAQDGSTNDAQAFVLDNGKTLRVGGGCLGSMCAVSQDWPKVASRDGPPDFACKP